MISKLTIFVKQKLLSTITTTRFIYSTTDIHHGIHSNRGCYAVVAVVMVAAGSNNADNTRLDPVRDKGMGVGNKKDA